MNMTPFTNNCSPSADLTDCANGWDVVYAVRYAAVNADIAAREPWQVLQDSGTPGTFDAQSGSVSISGAQITKLEIVPGGNGQDVLLQLVATTPPGGIDENGSAKPADTIKTTIRTQLAFTPGTQAGLHLLQIASAGASVTQVELATGDATLELELVAVMSALLGRADVQAVLGGVVGNVMTKDYAESVDIPWLTPQSYVYTVADMPSGTDGVIAIMANVGSTFGQVAQFDTLAFPTDPDVTAAAFVSTRRIGDETLVSVLNQAVGGSVIGALAWNEQTQTLVNSQPITALYALDGGTAGLYPDSASLPAGVESYPATIPIGGVTFAIADQAITASLNGISVDLGKGYTLTMSVKLPFQLMLDPAGNLDVTLSGSPTISTSLASPPPNAAAGAIEAGSIILGIIGGEAIGFCADKFGNLLTNASMTNATLAGYSLDFVASVRQMQEAALRGDQNVSTSVAGGDNENAPLAVQPAAVSMDIGASRKLVVASNNRVVPAPVPLSKDYSRSVRLNPQYVEPGGEMQPNVGAVPHAGVFARPQATVPNLLWESLALLSRSAKTGLETALGKIGNDVKATISQIDLAQLNGRPQEEAQDWNQLSAANHGAVYKTIVNFFDSALKSGKITLTPYVGLIRRFPAFTLNPIYTDFSGTPLPRISTIPGGESAVPSGFFSDMATSIDTTRAGMAGSLVKDVILNAPRPCTLKVIGILIYAAGLAGGYFLGNFVGDKFSPALAGPSSSSKTGKALDSLNSGAAIFQNVSFPLLETFQDGASGVTGPTPESVLRCAQVNGGIVLGVAMPIGRA